MGYWTAFCLKTIMSIKIEILGKENIIKENKFFIAASHQSIFETFYLQTIFNSPVFILKKELMLIPVFGWYLKKIGSISIKRNKISKDNLGFFDEIKKIINKSKRPLIIIPIITGKVTTKAIFKDISIIEISFDIVAPKRFAEVITTKGTEIILTKLVIAVREIDNATSPLANFVKTFDVTPPGAAAIIIKPTDIGSGRSKTTAMQKATTGKIINWEKKPIKKSFGFLIILVKSFIERPSPNPSIINARTIGAIFVTISIISLKL